MRPLETLATFWDLAHLDNPVLTHDNLARFPADVRDALLGAGLIKPSGTATSVECDGCRQGHGGEVSRFTYPDGQTRLFIVCPECGRVPVHPDRLRRWAPDYSLVADLIAEALQANGAPQQIVPGRLWDLGRAPLAGQARPVWLVCRLDDEVRQRLPADRRLVVFILGIRLRAELDMDEDRVFEVRHLVRMVDGKLSLDADAVREQLGGAAAAAEPAADTPRKRDARAKGIAAVKRTLRDQALMRKSARKRNWDVEMPALTQKQLAEAAGVSEPTLSRILNDTSRDRDQEVKMLWDIINDPEQLERYHG